MIKRIPAHNTGYTTGGFQSNLQAPGSLARAVTVDSESATKPARCIPSPLGNIKKDTAEWLIKCTSGQINYGLFLS